MAGHGPVIQYTTLVDGMGSPPWVGDLAIDGDPIVGVGSDLGSVYREVDATDWIVTPGFVDIHTHYGANRRAEEEPFDE